MTVSNNLYIYIAVGLKAFLSEYLKDLIKTEMLQMRVQCSQCNSKAEHT